MIAPVSNARRSAISSTVDPRETLMRITIRPKRIQHTGIDDTFRTLAARKRDDQEFDTTGQFQNVGHEFVGKIGSPGDIKIGDCTIERGKALGDSRANAPHPDDTHGLAGDPRYERHAAFGPISFTQKSVSTRDSPCDRQQQTDSHVGDISSQHVRCVGHPNPIRRGEGEIDRIRTNAVARHNLELGNRLHRGWPVPSRARPRNSKCHARNRRRWRPPRAPPGGQPAPMRHDAA